MMYRMVDGGHRTSTYRRNQSQVSKRRGLGLGVLILGLAGFGVANFSGAAEPAPAAQGEAAVQAVLTYAQAVADRDSNRVAQNDFVCLLKMVEAGASGQGQFLPDSDPV